MLRFEGSETYVATDDLKLAVNAALILQRPLLIKGEPGTGKTMLAERLPGVLPPLNDQEAIEATALHSVAGTLPPGGTLIRRA